ILLRSGRRSEADVIRKSPTISAATGVDEGQLVRNHFERLDEEQRALHDSWDNIVRVVLLVVVTSTAIWALCALTKYLVHLTADGLLSAVAKASFWKGAAILLGALLAGGIARGVLNRWESWRAVAN